MTNDNIVNFPKKDRAEGVDADVKVGFPPVPSLIRMLEDFLERAKKGDIIFAAVAVLGKDGVGYSDWAPDSMGPTMLTAAVGSVAFMNSRIMMAAVDGSEDA